MIVELHAEPASRKTLPKPYLTLPHQLLDYLRCRQRSAHYAVLAAGSIVHLRPRIRAGSLEIALPLVMPFGSCLDALLDFRRCAAGATVPVA
jgi:hypothetical protein